MKSMLKVGGILIVLAMLFSCGPPADPTVDPTPAPVTPTDPEVTPGPQWSDTVIVGTNADSQAITPLFGADTGSISRSMRLFDPLIVLHPDTLEPEPHLAESWDISEDGLVYTFWLRQDATWWDGEPITAHDVSFTIHTYLDPDYTGPWRARWMDLKGSDEYVSGDTDELPGFRLLDDHSFEMELKRPNAPFLAMTIRHLMPIPKHVLEGENITSDHPFNRDPLGSGPYKLVEWVHDSHIEFVANEDYWNDGGPGVRKTPLTPHQIERIIPEMATMLVALEAGEIHMIDIVSPADIPDLEANPLIDLWRRPGVTLECVQYNVTNPKLEDVRVRRAIAMALDMYEFCEFVMRDTVKPCQGPMAEAIGWAYTEVDLPRFDLEGAKQLLADAGYPDGFEITLSTNAGNAFREALGTYMQAQLDKIGIKAELSLTEWAVFFEDIQEGRFEIALLSAGGGFPDPDQLYELYHSRGVSNYRQYSNEQVDKLLEEARVTSNIQERAAAYRQVQELLAEDLPIFWGFYRPSEFATFHMLEGVKPSALGTRWDDFDWRVRLE